MKLKNILLVVQDIERSKAFYRQLFGLETAADFGGNVVLTEGLVLEEQPLWEQSVGRSAAMGGNDMELYFEEHNLDFFLKKLQDWDQAAEYVNECREDAQGRRSVRIYDPDYHVIEVRESMEGAVRRFLNGGMTAEQVSEKMGVPVEHILEEG